MDLGQEYMYLPDPKDYKAFNLNHYVSPYRHACSPLGPSLIFFFSSAWHDLFLFRTTRLFKDSENSDTVEATLDCKRGRGSSKYPGHEIVLREIMQMSKLMRYLCLFAE